MVEFSGTKPCGAAIMQRQGTGIRYARYDGKAGGRDAGRSASELSEASRAVSDHGLATAAGPAQCAAFRVRIWRYRCRQRRRRCTQLGRVRCRRNRAALWRNAILAAGRRQIVWKRSEEQTSEL